MRFPVSLLATLLFRKSKMKNDMKVSHTVVEKDNFRRTLLTRSWKDIRDTTIKMRWYWLKTKLSNQWHTVQPGQLLLKSDLETNSQYRCQLTRMCAEQKYRMLFGMKRKRHHRAWWNESGDRPAISKRSICGVRPSFGSNVANEMVGRTGRRTAKCETGNRRIFLLSVTGYDRRRIEPFEKVQGELPL